MKTLESVLNNLKVGYAARAPSIIVPSSKKNLEIIHFFFKNGWVKSYFINDNIIVYLRYLKNKPLFTNINLISTVGHRKYISHKSIKYNLSRYGSGTVILITSKGLLTLKEALFLGVGGELAFILYY